MLDHDKRAYVAVFTSIMTLPTASPSSNGRSNNLTYAAVGRVHHAGGGDGAAGRAPGRGGAGGGSRIGRTAPTKRLRPSARERPPTRIDEQITVGVSLAADLHLRW